MIIIGQDRDIIVNFDNVEYIDIVADLDGTGEIPFKIYFVTSSSREELGKYKTEERAKEVLQDIRNKYILINYIYFEGYSQPKSVFEMPEK